LYYSLKKIIDELRVPLFTVFVTALSLCSNGSFAQKIELGAGLGGFNYKGDISPAFRLKFFKPGGSLFFRYNPSQALSLRAEVAGGFIGAKDSKSDDPFQIARNMAFRTRITEGSAVAEYNFLNYQDKRFAINWTPYVFGGIGFAMFKPDVKTTDYKTSSLILPYGVGVKYQIKRPWSVGVEFGTRKTFTDYLDNLGGEPTSNIKLEQGNPSLKDSYYYLRLSVSYTFYKIFCP
jgi:opacity protein-like surface antigen